MKPLYMLIEYLGDRADFPRPLPLFFNSHEGAFWAMLIQLSEKTGVSQETLLNEILNPSMSSAKTYGILGCGAWDASDPNQERWCGWSIFEMVIFPDNTIQFNEPNPYGLLAYLWENRNQSNILKPYLAHELSAIESVHIPWERQNTSVLVKSPSDVTRFPKPLPQGFIKLEEAYDEMLRQVSEVTGIEQSTLETCVLRDSFTATDACGIYGDLAFFMGNDKNEPCDWTIYELATGSDGNLHSYWTNSSLIEKYLEDKELSRRATNHT